MKSSNNVVSLLTKTNKKMNTQRILKFRVWDNLKEHWVSNRDIWRIRTNDNGIGEIAPPAIHWKQHPQGLTIQQYTGLNDKNGKEIYEGDIVLDRVSSMVTDKEMDIFVVDYNETYSAFVLTHRKGKYWNWIRNVSTHGVLIGNTLETPGLIKNE